jgi:serine/threonine protein phosphatase PrpC
MAEIIKTCAPDPEKTVNSLVDTANKNGGVDNITAIVLRCDA